MRSLDAEIYSALSRAFGALQARWYVFGAQAAIIYGATRFTEDVDVTLDIGDHSVDAVVGALEREGFVLRVKDESFIEQTRVLPLFHEATGTPVDVVLSGPGIEETFMQGRVEIDVEDVKVPVARVEDVVVMKVLSARPKDLEDVIAILRVQGSVFDEQRTRSLLELLERELGQSDLTPVFEQCRKRANIK